MLFSFQRFALAISIAPFWFVNAGALAQVEAEVTEDHLKCIIEHAEDYLAQGEKIVLNFETCPAEPNSRESIAAHRAINSVLPPRNDGTKTATSLLVTPSQLGCLLTLWPNLPVDEGTELYRLLPDSCRSATQ